MSINLEKIRASKRRYWSECKDFINSRRRKQKLKKFCSECKSLFFDAHPKRYTCSEDCSKKRRSRILKEYNKNRSEIDRNRTVAKNRVSISKRTKNNGHKYTKEDIKEIMKSKDLFQTALKLGRSYSGVCCKRRLILKDNENKKGWKI